MMEELLTKVLIAFNPQSEDQINLYLDIKNYLEKYKQVEFKINQRIPSGYLRKSNNKYIFTLNYPNKNCKAIPLYISPAKRNPLTDKEIEILWNNPNTKNIARAVEFAHGIGETQ
jgi:hypothetical protein